MRKLLLVALLAVAPGAFASDLDTLVGRVITFYGGEAAWKKVSSIRESGSVSAVMQGTNGTTVRDWRRPDKLRVEIVYPDRKEVRDVDGDRGSHNDKPVSGAALDAMALQSARIALPLLLIEKREQVRDLGAKDGIRTIEVPVREGLTITLEANASTGQIVTSSGKAAGMQFVTSYRDLRKVGDLLFAFSEDNFAQGMKTGETTLESIEVK